MIYVIAAALSVWVLIAGILTRHGDLFLIGLALLGTSLALGMRHATR